MAMTRRGCLIRSRSSTARQSRLRPWVAADRDCTSRPVQTCRCHASRSDWENGGSKVAARPASVPTVSTPTPSTSRSFARKSELSLANPGVCGPFSLQVDVFLGIGTRDQSVRSRHPCACGNASVLLFPLLDPSTVSQKIRISGHICAHINHTGRADKLFRINFVDAVLRQVFAPDPMNRRVKMRAGMFSGLKAVPIPGWAAIVIARKLPDLEGRSVGPLRGQRQQRRLRAERLREVDDS